MGYSSEVPAVATAATFTGNIIDAKDTAGVDLFTLTGKGPARLGNITAPKGPFYLSDTLAGSTSSGSFAILSSNTIGSVASISATALTTGNIFKHYDILKINRFSFSCQKSERGCLSPDSLVERYWKLRTSFTLTLRVIPYSWGKYAGPLNSELRKFPVALTRLSGERHPRSTSDTKS